MYFDNPVALWAANNPLTVVLLTCAASFALAPILSSVLKSKVTLGRQLALGATMSALALAFVVMAVEMANFGKILPDTKQVAEIFVYTGMVSGYFALRRKA